jgi:hypothetical protein
MSLATLWLLLIFGYILTVLIEIPVLLIGLSSRYSPSETIINGLLLTAFTYPIVVMVLPAVFTGMGSQSRALYLAVAETYAPVAEVLLFRYLKSQAMRARPDRDAAVIVAANLASFLLGEAGLSSWLVNFGQKLVE